MGIRRRSRRDRPSNFERIISFLDDAMSFPILPFCKKQEFWNHSSKTSPLHRFRLDFARVLEFTHPDSDSSNSNGRVMDRFALLHVDRRGIVSNGFDEVRVPVSKIDRFTV